MTAGAAFPTITTRMAQEEKKRILFLCTGNSCRSQMAEGLARAIGESSVEVESAGTHPIGVHPRAIAAMKEISIDISGHASKGIDSAMVKWADLIVTLCGDARDHCPVPPAHVRSIHWPIHDPFGAAGSDEAIREEFRRVREDLRGRIEKLLKELGE